VTENKILIETNPTLLILGYIFQQAEFLACTCKSQENGTPEYLHVITIHFYFQYSLILLAVYKTMFNLFPVEP
jgi:hypothetical protein